MERHFEGNYRRVPLVNLAGASRLDNRSRVITRSQTERMKRERDRLLLATTIKMQALIRGKLWRRKWKEILTQEYENRIKGIVPVWPPNPIPVDDVCYLLPRAHFFIPKGLEFEKDFEEYYAKIFGYVMPQLQNIELERFMEKNAHWNYRITAFCKKALRFVRTVPDTKDVVVSILQTFSFFACIIAVDGVYTYHRLWLKVLNEDRLFARTFKLLTHYRWITNYYFESFRSTIVSLVRRVFRILDRFSESEEALRDSILYHFTGSILMLELDKDIEDKSIILMMKDDYFPLLQIGKRIMLDKTILNTMSMYRLLIADDNQTRLRTERQLEYFEVLSHLLQPMLKRRFKNNGLIGNEEFKKNYSISEHEFEILDLTCNLFHSRPRIDIWINHLTRLLKDDEDRHFISFMKCVYFLWMSGPVDFFYYRLYQELMFYKGFLRRLWKTLNHEWTVTHNNKEIKISHLSSLKSTCPLVGAISSDAIPLLAMFCFFFLNYTNTLPEEIFYKEDMSEMAIPMEFSLSEITVIIKALKGTALNVITFAYPSMHLREPIELKWPYDNIACNVHAWRGLLQVMSETLEYFYQKDIHYHFMPTNFWSQSFIRLSDNFTLPTCNDNGKRYKEILKVEPFTSQIGGCLVSSSDRVLGVITSMPFLIDINKRMSLFRRYTQSMRDEYQGSGYNDSEVNIQIRRTFLYEDAYSALRDTDSEDIRITLRVRMISPFGLVEPGIDGGGIFKEFIIELLKTAFDPNRGYFICNKNNELYPNPHAEQIDRDFTRHYIFIGLMLGKAIYEKITVDIPLADFFLSRIVGAKYLNPINDLASLDPELHKHLLSLLSYDGDFADLGLDFTLSTDFLGEKKVVELIKDGSSTSVTKENVLRYIHSVAEFKILSLSAHITAFFMGITRTIPYHWLAMFTARELQFIISGTDAPFDVTDLKNHAKYAHPCTSSHPTVRRFWRVFSRFSLQQKYQLFKFVTSCTKPPLLGFKELDPPFCIRIVPDQNQLPTSSTCLNMLNLPDIKSDAVMKKKLLYAIKFASGFELP